MRANRRTFLGWCVGLVSGFLSLIGCGPGRRTAIDAGRRATLQAAVERILPGAREAAVPRYVERALDHPYLRTMREPMGEGLDLLQALARSFYGADFAACDESQRDAILAHVQRGAADTPAFPASRFFERLVILTLEGFLGNPSHGGNRDCVGWRFIGYEPGAPKPGSCGKGGHEHR
jgi:hypothetical protein